MRPWTGTLLTCRYVTTAVILCLGVACSGDDESSRRGDAAAANPTPATDSGNADGSGGGAPASPTPQPSAEPSISPSATPQPSATPPASPSATPTPSASPGTTPAPSVSPSPSVTPSATPSPQPTATPSPSPSAAPRSFGEPNDNQIRPGVEVSSSNGSCTSNFVYVDSAGVYYIGAAAHCFSPDTNSGIDPCQTRNAPLGSDVEIENASFMGSLAYSSWAAMQEQGETPGSAACDGNDFALIRVDDRDLDNLHPAAFVFGGPTALYEGDAAVGDTVYSYGQSSFHLGASTLERKEGQITQLSGDGWQYSISTDNPGLSGDSGSAVLHEDGRALGVLVTVGACIGLCGPVSNGVVNLEQALAYANSVRGSALQVVPWADFQP